MMKKALFLFTLILALLFCACTPTQVPNETPGNEAPPAGETDDQTPSANEGNDDYLDIICRQAEGYTEESFFAPHTNDILTLTIPAEWELEEQDGLYLIMREGAWIGSIYMGEALDLDRFQSVYHVELEGDGFTLIEDIDRLAGSTSFRYRYSYLFSNGEQERKITLTASYEEIDNQTAANLIYESSLIDVGAYTRFGTLSHLEDGSILILGNSFVGSSNIRAILTEMIQSNGRNCTVSAISRGYATVATYIADPMLMADLRSGVYDAVFICGFYSEPEINNLKTLKAACDASGTTLVIFPAHNENRVVIDKAHAQFPTLPLLDWKGELDTLIDECGVDRWDLCVDDAHDHSLPSAGYIGAHMIYRAIYGEVPIVPMDSPLSQEYLDALFGGYAYSGYYATVNGKPLRYLEP